MPNVQKHAEGSFCWIELGTTHQNAAKQFYSGLFGWTVYDSPIGPGEVYTTFRLEGRNVAAAYTLRPDMKGVPPNWGLYMAVENADVAASMAAEAGGKLIAPPFDVHDFGRMAVIQDPTGALFTIWQSKTNIGIGLAGVPGTLCWADLSTADPAKASAFYQRLFQWRLEVSDNDSSGYLHIINKGEYIGGVPPVSHRSPNMPPHWLPYFAVEDCDAIAGKAEAGGGRLILPPMSMKGVGRMSVIADPQGAVFAIFKAEAH